jgi:4-amino-4-deoxychorismate lyase
MRPRLLETICCQDGKLPGLPFHQTRVRRSAQALGWAAFPDLHSIIIPEHVQKGRYKCRVLYRENIEAVEFTPYAIRPVHRLALIKADHIDYACKYEDRALINDAFGKRGVADDVLFVKNGLLTDTSYANIALWDGTRWLTPKQPLLQGTRRAQLLEQGRIYTEDIPTADLYKFEKLALFNAMMDLEEGPVIAVHPTNIKQSSPFTKK